MSQALGNVIDNALRHTGCMQSLWQRARVVPRSAVRDCGQPAYENRDAERNGRLPERVLMDFADWARASRAASQRAACSDSTTRAGFSLPVEGSSACSRIRGCCQRALFRAPQTRSRLPVPAG